MSIQEKIFLTAESNIGGKEWAKDVAREAKRNKHIYFSSGEYKCNLFVYEVLLAHEVDIGTPNVLNWLKHPILFMRGQLARQPTTHELFDEKVPKVKKIGEGSAKDINYEPGDIITNGAHIGILAKESKTISATDTEIVCNDWCFRENEKETFKIFRILED